MDYRKYQWRVPLLLLLTLLVLMGIGPMGAQAASISVSFEDMEISPDTAQVSIPVNITGLSDASTMEGLYLEIAFDQGKLEYSGLEAGSSAPAFQYFGNVQGNTLVVTGFAASAVKRDGEILKLKFNVKGKGNPVNFSIKKCEVNDSQVEVENGTISFKDSLPPNNIKVSFDNINVPAGVTEFTVPVKVQGVSPSAGIEGVLLELSYESQAVSYTGQENGSIAPGFQYFDNNNAGTLLITGFGASAIKSDGDILKLKFKIANRNVPPNIKITRAQINDRDTAFENGSITVNNNAAKVKIYYSDLTVGADEDSFILPVKIQGLTNDNTLEGILLKLTYDSSKLGYTGVEAGAVASGLQCFDNAIGNSIIINGFTTSPIKADGEILRLKFKVLKRVSPADVTLTSAQVNDVDVECTTGKITLEEKQANDILGLAFFTVNGNKITVTNPDQLSYSIKLDKVTSDLEVKATPVNKDDFVQITKTGFDKNGIATVTIKVMSAKDSTQIKTYTITVIAETLSGNANLKYIMINGKKIRSFSKGKFTYDYTIADCVKTLSVKAMPEDNTSTVRISGTTLDDNGQAQVQIAVIAQDGTTSTYTVNITSQTEPDFVIVGMSPGEEETNVPVDTNVVIDFSQQLNPETVDENSLYILNQNSTAIPVRVKLSMDKKTVTVDPVSDLNEEYEYTVVVSTRLYSLEDEQQFSADVQWTFKTGKKSIDPVVIPNKPTNLKGRATSSFAITWTWQDNSDNEEGFLLKDENGKTIAKIDRANTTVYVEKGLSPNTQYKRTVSAYVIDDLNNMVESEPSLPKTEKTLAYKVKPLNIFARVTEITSEKIIWRWYKKGEPGVLVKVYDKDMKEVGQVSQTSQKYEDYINIDKNSKEFTRNFTVYDPSMNLESQPTTVSVINPYHGTGKSLNTPLVKVNSLRDGKVTITIKDRSRDEQGFRLYRVNAAGQIQELVKTVMTPDTEGINQNVGVEIEGLDQDATYRYVVKAYNQTGEGDASEIVTINE